MYQTSGLTLISIHVDTYGLIVAVTRFGQKHNLGLGYPKLNSLKLASPQSNDRSCRTWSRVFVQLYKSLTLFVIACTNFSLLSTRNTVQPTEQFFKRGMLMILLDILQPSIFLYQLAAFLMILQTFQYRRSPFINQNVSITLLTYIRKQSWLSSITKCTFYTSINILYL